MLWEYLFIPDVRLRYCGGSSNFVLVRGSLACSSSHVRGHRRSLAWICRSKIRWHFLVWLNKFFFFYFNITCIRIRYYLRNRPRSIPDSNSLVWELVNIRTMRVDPHGKPLKWSEPHRRLRSNGRKPLHDSLDITRVEIIRLEYSIQSFYSIFVLFFFGHSLNYAFRLSFCVDDWDRKTIKCLCKWCRPSSSIILGLIILKLK